MKKSNGFYGLKFFGLLLLALSFGFSVFAADTYTGDKKVFGEVKGDKVLVYFICRPKQQVPKLIICDDEKVLTVIKENSYSFNYVEPGKHFLWWSGQVGNQIEFVPGYTYYIDLNYQRHTLLNENDGVELIKEVKYYIVPDQNDIANATSIMKKYYLKTLEREKLANLTTIGDISPQSTQHINETETIKVPAYTQIKLQPVVNISSLYNQKGDLIPFRIMEDVFINNEVCFRSGTLVKGYIRRCEPASGLGLSGFLDLVISEAPSVDGMSVPLIGRIINSGMSRGEFVSGMGRTFGLLGGVMGAMIKGQNSVELCGLPLTVWTRYDSWINVKTNSNANDDIKKGAAIKVNPIVVKEEWLTKKADDLKLNLSSEKEIKDIKVIGNKFSSNLGGKGAISLNKVNGGWEAVFNVWDIIRYVDFRDSVTTIELSGQFIDDTPFIAELKVNVEGK